MRKHMTTRKIIFKNYIIIFPLRVVVIMYFIIWRCSTTDVHRTHCILRKPFLRNMSWHNNGVYVGKSRMSSSETVVLLQRGCKLEPRLHLDYDTTVMGSFINLSSERKQNIIPT